MKHLGINIGHDHLSPGATHEDSGLSEYFYNTYLMLLLQKHFNKYSDVFQTSYFIQDPEKGLEGVIDEINNSSVDLLFSFHLNSLADTSAEGGAAYIYPSNTTAHRVSLDVVRPAVEDGLLTKWRGCIEATQERMGRLLSILHFTRPTTILVEPAFISNKTDRQKLCANIQQYAQVLADNIIQQYG